MMLVVRFAAMWSIWDTICAEKAVLHARRFPAAERTTRRMGTLTEAVRAEGLEAEVTSDAAAVQGDGA